MTAFLPGRVGTRGRAAFTLIELVISSAIGAMILVAGYACLHACFSSQKLIEPRSEVAQTARAVLNLITSDLRLACPLTPEMAFLGMDRTIEETEADNLDFATLNHTPRRPGEGDYCAVSYFLEKDLTGSFVLKRRRNPLLTEDPLSGGVHEELARDLLGVRFEYTDGFNWYDDWGKLEPGESDPALDPPNFSGMPEAVRVTLTFDSAPSQRGETNSAGPSMIFQTVVRLELLPSISSSPSPTGAAATGNATRGN